MAHRQQSAEHVVGIVLAGGRGTRLGAWAAGAGGKAAVPLGGRALLERVLMAVAPHVERVVVVAAHREAGAAAALPMTKVTATLPVPVEVIHDSVPDAGPLAALADALGHLASGAAAAVTAAVLVSCDTPLVRPAVVGLLLDRLRKSGARWVVPQVHGHPQPLLSALRPALQSDIAAHLARGRRDLRGLLAALAGTVPAAVHRLEADVFTGVDPSLDSFRDIDTPEDLAAIASATADDRCAATILRLLAARSGTICPSEVARAIAPDAWRPLMDAVRAAAVALAARGAIVVTQRGRPVDPATATGPIRYGRPDRG